MPLLLLLAAALLQRPQVAQADPFPPYWDGGAGTAVHFAPVAWPAAAAWIPYTALGHDLEDRRNQDGSNGGTSPQNYVNVSSGCADQTLPSVYYAYDAGNQVLHYRWRLERIAHTYATGPNAGAYRASDPWNSALWTVLIDLNGDGYRDFAVHLDGSSGSPATAVDRLISIYSADPGQSINYVGDPDIHLLFHNPTAFVDRATDRILNFQNNLTPTANWPNGAGETVWDYGTTRAIKVTDGGCVEYLADYQIPLAMLDATAVGGPKVTPTTPFALAFATANSLTNPTQKDFVFNGDFVADPGRPIPFGDTLVLAGGTRQAPIVQAIGAAGCGPAALTAQVADTLLVNNGVFQTSVAQVRFYTYADANGNGLPDDGNAWTLAAAGVTTNNPIGTWTAAWNSSSLDRGQYLIGVQAVDDAARNADGLANRVFSYLTAAEVAALTPPSGERWSANPEAPGVLYTTFNNGCGAPPPFVVKTADPAQTTVGSPVQFTVAVHNPSTVNSLTVSSIQDLLSPGFTYQSTGGGTLGSPTTAPTAGASGAIAWTFAPPVTVPPASGRTLIFTAAAANSVGTFSNVASAVTSAGVLVGDPASVGVGAPRLTIAKTADKTSAAPGDVLIFTIRYANDSPVAVTNAVLRDVLPLGLSFVSAENGGSYDPVARAVSWAVGNLAAGEGPYTVVLRAAVDNPYPTAAAIPLINTATITSDQTNPAAASSATFITAPRPQLRIQKSANTSLVAPGGQVAFTLSYANVGNAAATGVVLSDPIPAGFSFVSATGGGTQSSGVVTWNIGALAAGATGSVTVTMQAANPYTAVNPQTNTATLSAPGLAPAQDGFQVGVTQTACATTTHYFRRTEVNVGFAGNRRIANTTAPTDATAVIAAAANVGSALVELARFYQDPAPATATSLSGTATTTLFVDKSGSPQAVFRVELFAYNPTTGAATALGSEETSVTGNRTNEQITISFTIASGAVLPQGQRLLWIVSARSNHASQTNNLALRFDGTPSQSRSAMCTAALSLALNKQVNALSTVPGGTLQYTINFANTGTAAVTGATIVDTLPAGVTFQSAALNGVAVNPTGQVGQTLTFAVQSAGQAAGVVAAGASGTLVINVAVNQALAAGVEALTNTAALSSNQTTAVQDTAVTRVVRPNVSLTKAVSASLLVAGDVATFTLTALNNGDGPATNVAVQDPLPAQSFFTYVAGSAALNGVPIIPDPVSSNVLNHTLSALAPGAAAVLTFRMQVGPGAPAGVTTYDNTATVSDAQTQGNRSSNTVTVAISANPNLTLSKSVAPSGPLAPGEEVAYTLVLRNVGGAAALNVQVRDPIPAATGYVNGSLQVDGAAQTDVKDAGAAYFDAVQNRVVFDFPTLAAGATHTLTFRVRVAATLPHGSTPIPNTAAAGAANAATKTATADTTAVAATELSLHKLGPESAPYPSAVLSADVANSAVVQVHNAALLSVKQYVRIAGQTRQIDALAGNTLTLDAPITASAGAQVIGSLTYTLLYANTGNAAATGVTLVDALPPGALFVTAGDGGVHIAGQVTWNLGGLAAGATGSVSVTVFAGGPGSLTNHAALDCNETNPVQTSLTTAVGGLVVRKHTTTPLLTLGLSGATAVYAIEVVNTSTTAATGVRVFDALPAGFSYARTVAVGGNASRTAVEDPAVGDTKPVWGVWSIPGGGSLTVTFEAAIDATAGIALYQNPAGATATNLNVLDYDPLTDTAEDVQLQVPAVLLSKSASASTVPVNSFVDYTLVMHNTGDAAATAVQVTDLLPPGFTFFSTVQIAATGGAVRTATLNPTAGSTQPTWGAWDIPPGGQVSIVLRATTAATPGVYTNSAQSVSANSRVPNISGQAAVILSQALAVTLADFSAAQEGDAVRIVWETNSELNNRGFNLWRGVESAGPDRQLNSALIPSQSQGSPGGFFYDWLDTADLVPGTTYYYWLEDVDVNGTVTRHGPVSVEFFAPSAVGLRSVGAADSATAGLATPILLALMAAALVGSIVIRKRAATG